MLLSLLNRISFGFGMLLCCLQESMEKDAEIRDPYVSFVYMN